MESICITTPNIKSPDSNTRAQFVKSIVRFFTRHTYFESVHEGQWYKYDPQCIAEELTSLDSLRPQKTTETFLRKLCLWTPTLSLTTSATSYEKALKPISSLNSNCCMSLSYCHANNKHPKYRFRSLAKLGSPTLPQNLSFFLLPKFLQLHLKMYG